MGTFPVDAANSSSPGEVRIHRKKQDLVATAQAITIGEQYFDLSTVDRVIYRAAARINQASYRIGLAHGDVTAIFTFDAYKRGTELEDSRRLFEQVVQLLEATACPAIAQRAAHAVTAGHPVAFGSSPAARITADAQGLRPRQPFAKTVPWSQIVGADLREGQARVWTATNGVTDKKPKMSIDMMGWNAVVLPRVVRMLGGR
ncbi:MULTISPECIES: hypothetical protein [Pseudofrankia]|uniref:hypothetical protein n=1 Tax=Pseudofrankia TaxID=2994363 RepID=UPI000234D67A|nr:MULTISPECIES: hypothetical protein [Pseudofrankia]OHV32473.1 hypothetical protein BCD49_30085 [Pseudofrankia sp. EUN1h]